MSRILVLACCLLAGPVLAGQARVDGIRIWAAPDNTRLVFDVSKPVEHSLLTLKNPDRLVIDIESAKLIPDPAQPEESDGLLRRVRAAARNGDDLRVVLDLSGKVRPQSFLLRPNEKYGHRLVIDLHDAELSPVRKVLKSRSRTLSDVPRDIVVAIDAGHGGEDPGALGARGTREKNVTLGLARRLARRINREPGMRAVLVRDGDYYVSLRKRIAKARDARADLFISIHADAFRDRSVRGSSVFVLSQRGASSEMARLVAKRENASDLIGGVSLDDKDDLLARVLIDLQQSVTYEGSVRFARETLRDLGKINKLHKKRVEKAGFAVLKAPDIPSVLVETAFISNPAEERRLNDTGFQERLTGALMASIIRYFNHVAPANTRFAARRHIIRRGDTLSEIADIYNIGVNRLRVANNLRSDTIRIGQVLRIP
ncbi:MAG: N-acetylmuramoyl-L-alanine amidase [Gammaproteobacteria bacterium]|nr:MAG: N-acetylmuramoyl-L-alanine amidase [Gammaproteobacteria bacterium]